MATVTIQVDAFAPQKAIQQLVVAVGPSLVLNLVGGRLLEFVEESFRTRGRGKWKPLSWSTLALRSRGGDAPLENTGRYHQSFVQESDNSTFVEVGTNLKTMPTTSSKGGVPLGPIHEYGTGPYIIRVRNARMLMAQTGSRAFGGAGPVGMLGSRRVSNWMIFGKMVRHPGIPARPVLPGSPAEAEAILQPVIMESLKRAVDEH
jgi:phage gpG-like protein